MRNVDDRTGLQHFRQWRHKERSAGLAKNVDNVRHVRRLSAGQIAQRPQIGRTADSASICPTIGEGLEDLFANSSLPVVFEFRVRFFSMLVESAGHRSDGLIMLELQRAPATFVLPSG